MIIMIDLMSVVNAIGDSNIGLCDHEKRDVIELIVDLARKELYAVEKVAEKVVFREE